LLELSKIISGGKDLGKARSDDREVFLRVKMEKVSALIDIVQETLKKLEMRPDVAGDIRHIYHAADSLKKCPANRLFNRFPKMIKDLSIALGKNTDMVIAIDDDAVVNIMRLFNEPDGQRFLVQKGVPEAFVKQLHLLGFSGIANLLSAIKFAKYYELGENDIVLTVLTDSMELYGTRIAEYREQFGAFDSYAAAEAFARDLRGATTDHLQELTYLDRKRIHNLKYYTWVEQQGKTYPEIQAQWYDPDYWSELQGQTEQIDALIEEFNERVGLIGQYR
jgi:hypothetical protein